MYANYWSLLILAQLWGSERCFKLPQCLTLYQWNKINGVQQGHLDQYSFGKARQNFSIHFVKMLCLNLRFDSVDLSVGFKKMIKEKNSRHYLQCGFYFVFAPHFLKNNKIINNVILINKICDKMFENITIL